MANLKIAYKKTIFLGILATFAVSTLFGADFGFVLNGAPEYDSTAAPNEFSVTGTITPWIEALFAPTVNFYLSADLSMAYKEGKQKLYIPEFNRTELDWHPASSLFLQFGRQRYGDSAALVTSGLFDGIQGSLAFGKVRVSLGAFYTGFQFKERLEILLTDRDKGNYGKETDYDNFTDTYFASRRVLVPISLELNELSEQFSLVLNAIGQFDVNGDADDAFHSQYLEAHCFIEPAAPLHINIAAIAAVAEKPETQLSFAASGGVDWELPSKVQDLLSIRAQWASGKVNDTISAFFPISGISPGEIFTPRFSGVLYANASYSLRPHKTFGAELGIGYFARTDLETLQDAFVSDSRSLGGELYASVTWAPQSALRFTAGGGAFFPQLGEAFDSDEKIRVKANFGALISF